VTAQRAHPAGLRRHSPVSWRSFLIVIIIGACAGLLAWGMDSLSLEPVWIKSSTQTLTDQMLNDARWPGGGKAFSKLIYIDLDQASWETASVRPDQRTPAIRELDRRLIAQVLAQIAKVKPEPALVVLDVDISPVADGSAEAALRSELNAWNVTSQAPLLSLIRTEDCGLPPIAQSGPVLLRRWHPTPYDGLVAPTGGVTTRIVWACAAIAPQPDGRARSFAPLGCGQNPNIAIPSAGLLASWVHKQPPNQRTDSGSASRFEAAYSAQLVAVCNGQRPRNAELGRYLPVIFPPGATSGVDESVEDIPLNVFIRDNPQTLGDWDGALVVVGQSHLRSNDFHMTAQGAETTGLRLLGAYAVTAASFPAGRAPSWWILAIICLAFSAGTSLSFVLMSWVKQWLVEDVFAERPLVRRLTHAFLGPSSLSAVIVTASVVAAARLIGPLFSIEFWHQLVFCLLGSFVAVTLADIVVSDVYEPKAKSGHAE